MKSYQPYLIQYTINYRTLKLFFLTTPNNKKTFLK